MKQRNAKLVFVIVFLTLVFPGQLIYQNFSQSAFEKKCARVWSSINQEYINLEKFDEVTDFMSRENYYGAAVSFTSSILSPFVLGAENCVNGGSTTLFEEHKNKTRVYESLITYWYSQKSYSLSPPSLPFEKLDVAAICYAWDIFPPADPHCTVFLGR